MLEVVQLVLKHELLNFVHFLSQDEVARRPAPPPPTSTTSNIFKSEIIHVVVFQKHHLSKYDAIGSDVVKCDDSGEGIEVIDDGKSARLLELQKAIQLLDEREAEMKPRRLRAEFLWEL